MTKKKEKEVSLIKIYIVFFCYRCKSSGVFNGRSFNS